MALFTLFHILVLSVVLEKESGGKLYRVRRRRKDGKTEEEDDGDIATINLAPFVPVTELSGPFPFLSWVCLIEESLCRYIALLLRLCCSAIFTPPESK